MRLFNSLSLRLASAGLCSFLFIGCANKPPQHMSQEDMAKMMEAYQKASQPGEPQKELTSLEGTWTTTMNGWQPDGTACGGGTGTAVYKSILGGRYVEFTFDGTMKGPDGKDMPYHGKGTMGYDNGKKKYVSTWIDDMSTGFMISEGTKSGNVITSKGEFTDPLSGQASKTKDILTLVDKNNMKFELHMTGPDGKMYKGMEIAYVRK